MSEKYTVSIDDIHAYVDGQLAADRFDLFEQELAHNTELQETVAQYKLQNELLGKAFDPIITEPVPDSIHLPRKDTTRSIPWYSIAASVTLFICGGILGWQMKPPTTGPDPVIVNLVQPAASAYRVYSPEVRHPVEVGAEQEAHLVKWLSKRLGEDVKAPVLSSQGFKLVGGRLLSANDGPAAQFMYEDKQGQRLTLYVKSKLLVQQDTAFKFHTQNNTRSFYWVDGKLGYVLSGSISRDQLLSVANLVYQQIAL